MAPQRSSPENSLCCVPLRVVCVNEFLGKANRILQAARIVVPLPEFTRRQGRRHAAGGLVRHAARNARLARRAGARWLRHWRGSAPRSESASRSTCTSHTQNGEESDFACSLSFLVPHKHGGSGWRQPPNPSWLTAAVALTPCTASSRRRRADWLQQLWNGFAIAGIPCSVGLCARFYV